MLQSTRRPGRPRADSTRVPTSERILDVSSTMFMKHGYDGVSTDDVAKQCGVTKAMVYYYFSSKPNLFAEAMLRVMEKARHRTHEILQQDLPLYERLLQVAVARISFIKMQLNYDKFMHFDRALLSTSQIESMHNAERRLKQTLTDAFELAIAQGDIREEDADVVAHAFLGLVEAGRLMRSVTVGDEVDPAVLGSKLLTIFWRGVVLN